MSHNELSFSHLPLGCAIDKEIICQPDACNTREPTENCVFSQSACVFRPRGHKENKLLQLWSLSSLWLTNHTLSGSSCLRLVRNRSFSLQYEQTEDLILVEQEEEGKIRSGR